MSASKATVEQLSQALYNVLAPHIQAIVLTDGGGNAALSALSALLGQVYEQAPDNLKPDFMKEILGELGLEPAPEGDDFAALERPRRKKAVVH